jgi:hypothetical protein
MGNMMMMMMMTDRQEVWVVYLTPKIERIISLLSASPVGEAGLRKPTGMAYKD